MGATSGFKVGIASPVPIDIALVAAGAVNSWLAGNYNYDLSSAYPDVSQGKLSADDATNLGKLQVTQDAAGFFNLPVCKVLDLRSFPSAAKGTGFANSTLAFSFSPYNAFVFCEEGLLYPPILLFFPSPCIAAPSLGVQPLNSFCQNSSLRLRLGLRSRRRRGRRRSQVLR